MQMEDFIKKEKKKKAFSFKDSSPVKQILWKYANKNIKSI